MDSLDNTRTAPPASGFHEAVFIDSATTPADTLMVVIPDFSADHPFGDPDGVVWSPMGGALPQAGDRALVAESTDGSWWVLSWWSDLQQPDEGLESVRAIGALGQPAFQSSWANFDAGSTERPAGFYRHNGRAYLTGVIKSGTVGSAAFTLPAGYRPTPATQPRIYAVTSNGAFGAVFVFPSGDVVPAVGSNVYFSLDGINFRHA